MSKFKNCSVKALSAPVCALGHLPQRGRQEAGATQGVGATQEKTAISDDLGINACFLGSPCRFCNGASSPRAESKPPVERVVCMALEGPDTSRVLRRIEKGLLAHNLPYGL